MHKLQKQGQVAAVSLSDTFALIDGHWMMQQCQRDNSAHDVFLYLMHHGTSSHIDLQTNAVDSSSVPTFLDAEL